MGSNRGSCNALATLVGWLGQTVEEGVALLTGHRPQVGLLDRSDVEAACRMLGAR